MPPTAPATSEVVVTCSVGHRASLGLSILERSAVCIQEPIVSLELGNNALLKGDHALVFVKNLLCFIKAGNADAARPIRLCLVLHFAFLAPADE